MLHAWKVRRDCWTRLPPVFQPLLSRAATKGEPCREACCAELTNIFAEQPSCAILSAGGSGNLQYRVCYWPQPSDSGGSPFAVRGWGKLGGEKAKPSETNLIGDLVANAWWPEEGTQGHSKGSSRALYRHIRDKSPHPYAMTAPTAHHRSELYAIYVQLSSYPPEGRVPSCRP
jgi:hypothetical protein